jgi:hypothetical protein
VEKKRKEKMKSLVKKKKMRIGKQTMMKKNKMKMNDQLKIYKICIFLKKTN